MSRYTVPLVTLHLVNTNSSYKPAIFASNCNANRRQILTYKEQQQAAID